jgi:hypothetical protein
LGSLSRLRLMKVGDAFNDWKHEIMNAEVQLRLFAHIDGNAETVPNACKWASKFKDSLAAFRSVDSPESISQTDVDDIRQVLDRFESALEDDLHNLPTYIIEKIGAYSIDSLISRADEAFPPSVTSKIPPGALKDFRSAGACLAFDLSTACGFHSFRATDAMLRKYCEHFGAVPKGNGRDWGRHIAALREVAGQRKPNIRTIELLDSIRAIDRNPLVHPELILDREGALVVFDLCKNAISLMALDITNSP